ncbi:hypothetical protein ACIGXG_30010 [Streptomyces goshikiensis]|uniref:hypothetical protein n=1 Tax=Streptomyces goshikiensis TaxID=1942 RepID=UPI0037D4082E
MSAATSAAAAWSYEAAHRARLVEEALHAVAEPGGSVRYRDIGRAPADNSCAHDGLTVTTTCAGVLCTRPGEAAITVAVRTPHPAPRTPRAAPHTA